MATDRYENVKTEEQDGILTIRLDRPDSLNSLTTETVREFRSCLEDLHESPPKGVLLTGTGDATCAGLDLSLAEQDPQNDEVRTFDRIFGETVELLRTYPRPVAVAGKGAVVGGGFIYFVNCDLAVVGDGTTLMLPEVKYGLDPTDAIEPLKHQVGERIGKEIALTGSEVEPERAMELGLVNDVVPEDDVDVATRELLSDVTQHDAAYEQGVVEDIIAEFD